MVLSPLNVICRVQDSHSNTPGVCTPKSITDALDFAMSPGIITEVFVREWALNPDTDTVTDELNE